MCFMKTPKIPDPAPIQEPPKIQDTNITKARTDQQQRLRASAGSQSTILTGGGSNMGAGSGLAQGKTVLGA